MLLHSIAKLELKIVWDQIIDYQYQCLKNDINGVGIPNLIIAQNAIQNHSAIFTHDKNFNLMKDVIDIKLIE